MAKLTTECAEECMEQGKKPPLGVRPGQFAAIERIRELLAGLERYADDSEYIISNTGHAVSQMNQWTTEIKMQLSVLEDISERWEAWEDEQRRSERMAEKR